MMICCISLGKSSVDYTLNLLRYVEYFKEVFVFGKCFAAKRLLITYVIYKMGTYREVQVNLLSEASLVWDGMTVIF